MFIIVFCHFFLTVVSPQGVISVSYTKQTSGEIQVLATQKECQPVPMPPNIKVVKGVPKCTTGVPIHGGSSVTSGKMGKV